MAVFPDDNTGHIAGVDGISFARYTTNDTRTAIVD